MGKANFYRKVGLAPPRSRKAIDAAADTAATQRTDNQDMSEDNTPTCTNCGEAVGWDKLEAIQRPKTGWLD